MICEQSVLCLKRGFLTSNSNQVILWGKIAYAVDFRAWNKIRTLMDLETLKSKGLIRTLKNSRAHEVLFPFGLCERGLHEVAECAHGDMSAVTGFVLAIQQQYGASDCILWVSQKFALMEHGRTLQTGAQFFAAHDSVRLLVEVSRISEALWAIEEGVTSGTISLIVAELMDIDFTATRRLALASERHGVPVVLLLPHDREGATAAQTRWRVESAASSLNIFDPYAPGHTRWHAKIERSRVVTVGQEFDLEWNDETLSLHLVSGMVDGQAAPSLSSPEPQFETGLRDTG